MSSDLIYSFLVGVIDIQEFLLHFQNDPATREAIRDLVPTESIDNPNHPFWKNISYSALKGDEFDLVKHIERICRFDTSIGDNLNLWGTLKAVYKYFYPDTRFTEKYSEIFALYLDAVGESFEGTEVEKFVERIVIDALAITPKAKRRKEVKEKIKEAFHVDGSNRPHWIQGAEWPMGKKAPMRFVKRTRTGERVDYQFVDVDTGEIRTVSQYY